MKKELKYAIPITEDDVELAEGVKRDKEILERHIRETDCFIKYDLLGLFTLSNVMEEVRNDSTKLVERLDKVIYEYETAGHSPNVLAKLKYIRYGVKIKGRMK